MNDHPHLALQDTLRADVCLLMLRRPARCGAALKARGALPRLDGEPSLAVAGANATIVGWGATYDDSGHGQVEGVPRWPWRLRDVSGVGDVRLQLVVAVVEEAHAPREGAHSRCTVPRRVGDYFGLTPL